MRLPIKNKIYNLNMFSARSADTDSSVNNNTCNVLNFKYILTISNVTINFFSDHNKYSLQRISEPEKLSEISTILQKKKTKRIFKVYKKSRIL